MKIIDQTKGSATNPKLLYLKSRCFFETGDYGKAIDFCDKSISKEASTDALILKSILLHNKKESKKSISILSEIIAKSPQSNKALLARGQIYEEISEFPSAISDYMNLKKSDIKNSTYLFAA